MAKVPTRLACYRAGTHITRAIAACNVAKADVRNAWKQELYPGVSVILFRRLARSAVLSAQNEVKNARGHLNSDVRYKLSRAIKKLNEARLEIPLAKKHHYGPTGIDEIIEEAKKFLRAAHEAGEKKCRMRK